MSRTPKISCKISYEVFVATDQAVEPQGCSQSHSNYPLQVKGLHLPFYVLPFHSTSSFSYVLPIQKHYSELLQVVLSQHTPQFQIVI